MDDFRRITYVVLIGFVLVIVLWVSFVTFSGCGFAVNCPGAVPTVERTSIPSLVPATMPALSRELGAAGATSSSETPGAEAVGGTATPGEPQPSEQIARPSNAGGPGPAINLMGEPATGSKVFVANCQICHNAEGKGGNPNPGSSDGTIPPLNPIDPTLKSADYKEFATNLDLFIEHGSTPEGTNPTFSMLAWGDKSLLAPQQIADVIAYVISLNK